MANRPNGLFCRPVYSKSCVFVRYVWCGENDCRISKGFALWLSDNVLRTDKPMKLKSDLSVKCSECPIRHRAVCARCDADELARMESMKYYRRFEAGEPVLWRGETLPFVATVVEGVASLSKTLEDGRTQTVGLLLPSDFIGRPGRDAIDFDVAAMTEVTLCCFQKAPFEKLVEETPHVAQQLLSLALDELDAARDWMLLLGRKTAREKIATFVQLLVKRTQPDPTQKFIMQITLPLTRDQIANYLGLTLETVSRQMNALKKEGVLEFTGRRDFEVLDLGALHAATGDDSYASGYLN